MHSLCICLTLISMSPTFCVDRIIGRPTIDGNMWAGKLDPANPHFTNWKKAIFRQTINKKEASKGEMNIPPFHCHIRWLSCPSNPWRMRADSETSTLQNFQDGGIQLPLHLSRKSRDFINSPSSFYSLVLVCGYFYGNKKYSYSIQNI